MVKKFAKTISTLLYLFSEMTLVVNFHSNEAMPILIIAPIQLKHASYLK